MDQFVDEFVNNSCKGKFLEKGSSMYKESSSVNNGRNLDVWFKGANNYVSLENLDRDRLSSNEEDSNHVAQRYTDLSQVDDVQFKTTYQSMDYYSADPETVLVQAEKDSENSDD
jgi:hypothetical protein